MSNYLYSSNAVDSLIAYINDVKPFHSKLSEVVEEYQFYEKLNVSIGDGQHFTRTKFAGIWDSESYSNGLYAQRIPLPFIKQAKSSKYWNSDYTIDPVNIDQQIPGLLSAYYLAHNIGVRKVLKDNICQIEGIDFHVSHGAHTVQVDGQNKKYAETVFANLVGDDASKWVKGAQIISEPTDLRYNDVEDQNGIVTNIQPNFDAPYEEWTVECVQASTANTGASLSYDHNQVVPSAMWNVQHRLDSFDIFTQVYLETPQGLTPISPKHLIFVDRNTLNVQFSTPKTGKVKIVRYVDSSQTFSTEIVSPSAAWTISHGLNSRNLIFTTKMVLNGTLEQINPNSIEVIDDNNVIVHFTTPKVGRISIGKTDSYTTAVFEQATPATAWSFDNTLRSSLGIFAVVRDDGSIIFPQNLTISNTLIFVEFSQPTAGKLLFVRLFAAGNESTLFSVRGSETGLIGYAKLGLQFASNSISLLVKPKSDESVFTIGEKYVLTPANRITTHKSYTANEKWSLIKVNPIAYLKPRFSKAGSPTLTNFTIKTDAIRPQVLSLVYGNGVFTVSNSLGESLGSSALGVTFSNAEVMFHISAGTVAPADGDFFEVEIVNLAPSIENLDLTVGYDIQPFDDTEYDDHLVNFDLTSLNLSITNAGILESYFELYFNGTDFDVKQYDTARTRNLLSTYTNAQVGVDYSNGEISFKIPNTVTFVQGDVFIFDVKNPKPSFDADSLSMVSQRFGGINLYPKSFINSPAQRWKIEVNADASISVTGTVSGAQASGLVAQSYDNGFIHFTLIPSTDFPFVAGDKFFVAINDEKPSYLVHNEVTGFSKPLVLGKWYWNGKIGLKIDKPHYKVEEYISNTLNGKSTREFETGLVVLDGSGRTLTFNKAPRYDAKSDVYHCDLVPEIYKSKQIFKVSSANFGIQRGAKVGQRYVDDMRQEQSRNLGFTHHDGVIDVTISDNGVQFHADSQVKFEVVSKAPKLFHANDLIIFNTPIANTVSLAAERETVDKIYFKTNSKRSILGVDANSNENQWFPTYSVPTQPFSDECDTIDVYSSILDEKIGSVLNVGGAKAQYQFAIDPDFFNDFLPFNTLLSSKVIQNEQENSIVKARITERMKVFDFYRLADALNVHLHEMNVIHIDSHSPQFHDTINVSIDDRTFRGFFSGYDTNPFDIEANGYDDTDTVQFTNFSASAGGIGYLVQGAGQKNTAPSKIGEVVAIYSKLADDVIDFADAYGVDGLPALDAEGWTNANVIDGVPPVDAEGWDAAVFDIDYSITPSSVTLYPYELTATVGKLSTPTPGSPLYGTPYTNVPSALVSVNRSIISATIMKRGLNASSVIMYSDLASQTQVQIVITENTNDYVKFDLLTPSIGQIVIF